MTDFNDPAELGAEAEAQETKAKRKVLRDIEDLKWLMADARGRRFVARLLERTGTMRSSFHTSGSVMAFNEGRRDIGLFITDEMLQHTPKAYSQLLNEYRNDD